MKFTEAKRILSSHKEDLSHLGVKAVAIFGSTARDDANNNSDVDILVDFDSKRGFFVFIDLKNYLENILKCHVDLVTKNALHPALKSKILQESKNVF